MPRMRSIKADLRRLLDAPDWRDHLHDIAATGLAGVGPLLSFLLLDPLTRHKAAVALGAVVAGLEKAHPEAVRNIMRRLMWQMNEESGNIGWGIPEAFAEILAQHRRLGDEFYPILNSYVIDTGKGDNFCDNNVLRRSCFRAVERFALARPDLASKARGPLQAGLRDEDPVCREIAREALGKIGMF